MTPDVATLAAQQQRDALIWAERQLCALVTEDDGNGAFIRGTSTELVGFGAGMEKLRAAIRATAPEQEKPK